MLIVFGSICIDIYLDIEKFPDNDTPVTARDYLVSNGGKAANQAFAAVRSGAKVALVGKVGNGLFSKMHLNKLRHEGVMTSGVAKSDLHMGTRIYIQEGNFGEKISRKAIIAPGANDEASADQIPDDILDSKSFLLLQTEINHTVNEEILERAKKFSATTLMNLSPSIDFSQNALNNLDYLIVNQEEARLLAERLGINTDNDSFKLAEGLSKQGNLNCIITAGSKGSVIHTKDNKRWSVEALDIEEVVDRTGAQDAYCGTLAACLYAGMALPRAVKRASIAASLTCTKKGGQTTFPYLDDIDQRINDLDDPKDIDL